LGSFGHIDTLGPQHPAVNPDQFQNRALPGSTYWARDGTHQGRAGT
jgi:hypothetical protein